MERISPVKSDKIAEISRVTTAFIASYPTAAYKEPPVLITGAVASIVDNGGVSISITSATYYAWGADLTIQNVDSVPGEFNVSIDGYALRITGEQNIVSEDADGIVENGLLKYTFPKNHLVQSPIMAKEIADTLLNAYKTPRKDINVSWRGNPALELADIIEVPEYQRGEVDVKGNFKIFRNKIDFDGTIKETTEGRKILPPVSLSAIMSQANDPDHTIWSGSANTWIQVNNFTPGMLIGFSFVSNYLQLLAPSAGKSVLISYSITFSISYSGENSGNNTLKFALFQNGNKLADSEEPIVLNFPDDYGDYVTIAGQATTALNPGDNFDFRFTDNLPPAIDITSATVEIEEV